MNKSKKPAGLKQHAGHEQSKTIQNFMVTDYEKKHNG